MTRRAHHDRDAFSPVIVHLHVHDAARREWRRVTIGVYAPSLRMAVQAARVTLLETARQKAGS